MQLIVTKTEDFIGRLKAFGTKEVAISQSFSRIFVSGAVVHFGLVELSTYGAYDVHYVDCAGVRVARSDEIPADLIKDTKKLADAFEKRIADDLNKEHQGYGKNVAFINGIFGDPAADKILNRDIAPVRLSIGDVQKKIKQIAEEREKSGAATT